MLRTPGYLYVYVEYIMFSSINIVHHRRPKRDVLSKPFRPGRGDRERKKSLKERKVSGKKSLGAKNSS